MSGFSEHLHRIPGPAKVAGLLVLTAICVGFAWHSARPAGDYQQEDIPLKCLECGYTETLSVAEHHARVSKELPGGAPLIEGPELICPRCSKKSLVLTPPPPPPASTPAVPPTQASD